MHTRPKQVPFGTIFIQSHSALAFYAVLWSLATQVQLGMTPQYRPYLALIFFSTLLDYNLHTLFALLYQKKSLLGFKQGWVVRHTPWFYTLMAVSFLGATSALLVSKRAVCYAFLCLAVLTLAYAFPFAKKHHKILILRQIPFLKIFLIAIVWSLLTTLLPIFDAGYCPINSHEISIITERFLFIFAIALPFDIRDMAADKQAQLRTFPLLWGIGKTEKIASIVLGAFLFCAVLHYAATKQYFILYALILSFLSTFLLFKSKYAHIENPIYYELLDATIGLQAFFIILFYNI